MQLHVVVPHAEEPAAALAADGEGFDQEVVERLARVEPAAELGGLGSAARRRSSPGTSASSALIASTFGCKPLAGTGRWPSRTAPVIARFEPAEDGVADAGEDFPNAFQELPSCALQVREGEAVRRAVRRGVENRSRVRSGGQRTSPRVLGGD